MKSCEKSFFSYIHAEKKKKKRKEKKTLYQICPCPFESKYEFYATYYGFHFSADNDPALPPKPFNEFH